MKTIAGPEAIARMREMRHDEDSFFELHHLTWDRKNDTTNGMRLVVRCRLRVALPKEKFYPHQDLYLPYIDWDLAKGEQNRMCFKRLIRYVAFPPDFELLKVEWFKQM